MIATVITPDPVCPHGLSNLAPHDFSLPFLARRNRGPATLDKLIRILP